VTETHETSLQSFAEPGLLQERLASAMGRHQTGVAVAYYHDGLTHSASISGTTNFSPDTPVPIGCLAKILTADLVAQAIREGRMRLDECVANLLNPLELDQALSDHLRLTRVHHLLTHTHGFDILPIAELPRSSSGYVDTKLLFGALVSMALPGEFFYYNKVGHWITAAVLERVYHVPYTSLVTEKILSPMDLVNSGAHSDDDANFCPATNQALHLSAKEILRFVLLHLCGDRANADLLEQRTRLRETFAHPLPKWPHIGKNICPAWFDYGETYGQIGYGERTSNVVRFFPRKKTAIIVTAEHQRMAGLAMSVLFGDMLKDQTTSLPKLLSPQDCADIDFSLYTGTFENGKFSVTFDVTRNQALRAQVFRRDVSGRIDDEPHVTRYMRLANNQVFLPNQLEPHVIPMAEFFGPRSENRFPFLRAGTRIFVRRESMYASDKSPPALP
jgi:CubicO group peptidase (beta-lactamase class C family)